MAKLRAGIFLLLVLLLSGLLFMGKGEITLSDYLASPGEGHIFGCDALGRDLFSRCMYALLVSFSVSFAGALLSLIIALFVVFLCRREGIVRTVVISLLKAVKTVPSIILALFMLSFGGNGIIKLVLTLSFSGGATTALMILPLIKAIEGEEYIIAERSLGIGEGKIFFHHIVPTLAPFIMENFFQSMISMIITESSLSFLGLGPDETVPTLGRMLSEGRSLVLTYPHTVVFPALVLFLLGLSVMLISRGLSELDSSLH